MDKNESFSYSYSASQQEEIKNIRNKYTTPETSPLEQLKKLDQSATQKAVIVSLVIGIISALVMGVGMSCVLVWKGTFFIPGIIIGIVGLIGASFAYPIYNLTLKRARKKISPQIIKLTDELLK